MSATEPYFQLTPRPGCHVVTLLPSLNSAQWSEIERSGSELIRQLDETRTTAVMLDLTQLNYMGSPMVALMVRCWKALKNRNGKLAVVCDNDVVREVITLAGLTQVWPVVDTSEEALEALGVQQSRRGKLVLRMLGLLGLIVAVAAAGMLLTSVTIDRRLILGSLFGGAGLGVFAGLAAIWRDSTRYLDLGLALASAAVAVFGFLSV